VSETEGVAAVEVAPPPEAPSTTEAPETVEVQAPETTETPANQALNRHMSRRERVQAIHDRITTTTEQPRGPDGKFVAQESAAEEPVAESEEEVPVAAEETEVATQPKEADSAAPEEVAESGADETATPQEPQLVSIPLDPSHPLYAQGITELKNVPAHLERAMRTMANASVRKQEVEQARAAQQAAETELAMAQARMELLQSGEAQAQDTSPEMQKLLADIEQAYPEQIDTVKSAFEALQQQAVQGKEAEIMANVQREQVGRQFMHEVSDRSTKHYPIWAQAGELPERLRVSVAQYGDYVDARNANLSYTGQPEQMPNADEFFTWLDTNYVKDQRVQSQLADYKQRSEAKIGDARAKEAAVAERRKIAEEEKQRLSEAATRHGTKPPSPPPMRSQGNVVPPTPANEEARKNHGTRQRDLRSSIRQRLQSTT
jgi:hypothetical protein